jgi:hypothetical protein
MAFTSIEFGLQIDRLLSDKMRKIDVSDLHEKLISKIRKIDLLLKDINSSHPEFFKG